MINGKLNFCTLFDSHYLSRGLAMYESLATCCEKFHLYVFAFDSKSDEILRKLDLPKMTIISLGEWENKDLLAIKPTRSRAEYCWTCSSSILYYSILHYELDHCTYLDADLYFYHDPRVLVEEMGEDDAILITEHRFSPKYEKSLLSGRYCVQFITFKNNEWGMKALTWWKDRCIEWCYNRHEGDKFGDQKYLDDWTTRFEGVVVLKNPGGGLAAWNIQQYEVFSWEDQVICRERTTGKEFLPVFYHFHYVRFFKNAHIELGRRELTREVIKLIYLPYILYLEKVKKHIASFDDSFDPHGTSNQPNGIKSYLIKFVRKCQKVFHIYSLEDLLKF